MRIWTIWTRWIRHSLLFHRESYIQGKKTFQIHFIWCAEASCSGSNVKQFWNFIWFSNKVSFSEKVSFEKKHHVCWLFGSMKNKRDYLLLMVVVVFVFFSLNKDTAETKTKSQMPQRIWLSIWLILISLVVETKSCFFANFMPWKAKSTTICKRLKKEINYWGLRLISHICLAALFSPVKSLVLSVKNIFFTLTKDRFDFMEISWWNTSVWAYKLAFWLLFLAESIQR